MEYGRTIEQRLKDPKTGQTRGRLIAFLDPEDQKKILVGYSQCHSKLDQYNKEFAHQLCYDRAFALDKRLTHWVSREYPSLVKQALPHFLSRCVRYFKGAELTHWAGSLYREIFVYSKGTI